MNETHPLDQRFYDAEGEPQTKAIYESFCADAITFLDDHPVPFQDLVDDQGLDLSESDYPAFVLYVEEYEALTGQDLSELSEVSERFRDVFYGYFDSEADFAEHYAEECGDVSDNLPFWIVIDWQAAWDRNMKYDFDSEYIEELGQYAIYRKA